MARYVEVGDLSEDGDAIADAMRAEADAIVFEATPTTAGWRRSGSTSCPTRRTGRSGS